MKGLILCAGMGSRFGSYTNYQHKLLLTVNDVPLIDYTLMSFAHSGIDDVGLVTGFMGDQISNWVGDGSRYGLKVSYIFNSDYKLGNAVSLKVSQTFTDGQAFILSMGDHMVSSNLLTNVIEYSANSTNNVLGVDFNLNSRSVEDDTRVLVVPGQKISSIGKHINSWNGIDTGVFWFNSEIYGVIDQWIANDKSERYELGDALDFYINKGGLLKSCDISNYFWHDVDNLKDLQHLRNDVDNLKDLQHLQAPILQPNE